MVKSNTKTYSQLKPSKKKKYNKNCQVRCSLIYSKQIAFELICIGWDEIWDRKNRLLCCNSSRQTAWSPLENWMSVAPSWDAINKSLQCVTPDIKWKMKLNRTFQLVGNCGWVVVVVVVAALLFAFTQWLPSCDDFDLHSVCPIHLFFRRSFICKYYLHNFRCCITESKLICRYLIFFVLNSSEVQHHFTRNPLESHLCIYIFYSISLAHSRPLAIFAGSSETIQYAIFFVIYDP